MPSSPCAGTKRHAASVSTSTPWAAARRSPLTAPCSCRPCRTSRRGARRLSCVRGADPVRAAQRSQDGHLSHSRRAAARTAAGSAAAPGTEVASLRPGLAPGVAGPQITGRAERWREWLTTELPALASFADGTPALVQAGNRYYLGCWPDQALLAATLEHLLVRHAGLIATLLPSHTPRRRGDLTFAFNYGPEPWQCPADADYLLGGSSLTPQDLACWRS